MRKAWLLAALAVALAGCQGAVSQAERPEVPMMAIAGIVVDGDDRPVAAAVVVLDRVTETLTAANGTFLFEGLELAPHHLSASALGFVPANLTVQPAPGRVAAQLRLEAAFVPVAVSRTLHFSGIYECAAEALIVSGSCGRLVTYVGDELQRQGAPRPAQDPFQANASYGFDVPEDWTTIVLDLVFEPGASPGTDGLRLVVRDDTTTSQATDYENVATFQGGASFSARIEPNGTYGGDKPATPGAGLFQVEVFPHSHLWHPGGQALLGVGGAVDLRFDLYVTVFSVLPAPEGFTLLP